MSSFVDGFDEVLGITVFLKCFLKVFEFVFLGFGGVAMSVDTVDEGIEAAYFMLCWVVAVVVQDLICVGTFSVNLGFDRSVLIP